MSPLRTLPLVPYLLMLGLPGSGLAQANGATLAGCFTFEAGPYERDASHVPHATSMLQNVRLLQPPDSGRLVLLDHAHSSDLSRWEMLSRDSVQVSLNYGFSGIAMRLGLGGRPAKTVLSGVGIMWSDGMNSRGNFVARVAIAGRRIECSDE